MRKVITVKFQIGDEVTLKRIVTGIVLREGSKTYELACGEVTTWHQAVEIEKYPEKKTIGGFKGTANK